MSLRQAKKSYDSLLKSGDLLEMFPNLTGSWKEDKEEFIEMYNLNNDILGS
mgnify:CR=1 FL=1